MVTEGAHKCLAIWNFVLFLFFDTTTAARLKKADKQSHLNYTRLICNLNWKTIEGCVGVAYQALK